MICEIEKEKGIVNRGNQAAIKACMEKAQRGDAITVGFLGGSITQGSLSSLPEKCYAYLTYEWWKKTFPQSQITYVNAGIGGTTSQFGVARVEKDLLCHRPDFVIVEFSVNDDNTQHFLETYEGLICRMQKCEKPPAILIVHNVRYDDYKSAEEIHLQVANYYQLPAVSMKSTILPKVQEGTIAGSDITRDDLHPNDAGHELVAEVICYALESMYSDLENKEEIPEWPAGTITGNAYEQSVCYQNTNSIPVCNGFLADEREQGHITDVFKNGWQASEQGSKIVFEIEGSCIAVQYRKTIQRPAKIARLIVDGNEENAIYLDANFDEEWGDKLELDTVLEHGEYKKHRVEIEIVETQKEDKEPFYLVSLIGS